LLYFRVKRILRSFSRKMFDLIWWLVLGACVLVGFAGFWMVIAYWLTAHVDNPGGKAIITGPCGDTMEIALKFDNGHVSNTSCFTDGCLYSLNCVHAAADLAKGKTPDEIIEIDSNLIRKAIGGLPDDHVHCAKLAEETLMAALDDYMRKQKEQKLE
jgi:hypothetical protein